MGDRGRHLHTYIIILTTVIPEREQQPKKYSNFASFFKCFKHKIFAKTKKKLKSQMCQEMVKFRIWDYMGFN